jgi:hypothetical protein
VWNEGDDNLQLVLAFRHKVTSIVDECPGSLLVPVVLNYGVFQVHGLLLWLSPL